MRILSASRVGWRERITPSIACLLAVYIGPSGIGAQDALRKDEFRCVVRRRKQVTHGANDDNCFEGVALRTIESEIVLREVYSWNLVLFVRSRVKFHED